MSEIYEPAEDSYLMVEALEEQIPTLLAKTPELKFLEIGCGSGINMQTALDLGIKRENIFGCDINKDAVKHCKKLGFTSVASDLFDKIEGKFDIIVFNPPYLPLDKDEPDFSKKITTGGLKGNEITLNFLEQAKEYLSEKGKIFLITSSLAKEVDFGMLGYEAKEILSKKLFFEKLVVWECLKV